MISDEERREVARRLRELGKVVYSPDNTYELMADALGVDDFEGTDELFNRLADLIDPGGHECVPGGCPLNVRHDNDFVDRDALLALADEMERELDECADDHEIVGKLQYRVDRIREALGVRAVEADRPDDTARPLPVARA